MRRSIYTLGIVLFLFSPLVRGQGLSTINGTVTDPSGAVVAGSQYYSDGGGYEPA